MADPTLKDVLAALEKLSAKIDTKADGAEMREAFARLEKQVADLDRDLDGHMKVHREIEKDIDALKKRPARTAARPTRTPRQR